MTKIARYNDGQEINAGDFVKIDDQWDGVVEEIILESSEAWDDYWKDHGEGVMLTGEAFGRLFVGLIENELVLKRRR